MVGSTRQSARVKAQASRMEPSEPVVGLSNSKRRKKQDPESEGAVESEDEMGDQSEKREYNVSNKGKGRGKGKQGCSKATPKKRAKTTNKSGRRKNADFTGKLSLLPSQPFDILLEILRYLPLESLLALTRVNQLFRKTLLSQELHSLWTSFRKSRRAPEPMPGLSEQQWAQMLFIYARCGKTRKGAVYRIFQFGKRLCSACYKAICINKRAFQTKYRGRSVEILDLVLFLPDHPHNHYPVYEIEKVLATLDACKDDEARNLYTQERIQLLERMKEHVQICERWKTKDQTRDMHESYDGRTIRREQIRRKMLELGYTEEDVERSGFTNLPSAIANNELTDRGWALIKTSVIRALQMSRVCRAFASAASSVLLSRREMLSDAYNRYKRTLSPLQWRELPNLPTVMFMYPSIHSLFTVPDSHSIGTQEVGQAFNETLPQIADLSAGVRSTLTEQLKRGEVATWRTNVMVFRDEEQSTGFVGPTPAPNEASLDLASFIIHCDQCRSQFPSVQTAIHHLHCPLCCFSTCAFSVRFSLNRLKDVICLRVSDSTHAVVSVIQAAGMDVQTTTADQMDEKGNVFCCIRCENRGHTLVGTWRQCVKHYGTRGSHLTWYSSIPDPVPGPEDPLFKRVDDGGENHYEDQRKCWACARCLVHLVDGGNVTRADVVEHLASEHDVSNPTIPADFFYNGHECGEDQTRMAELGLDEFRNSDSRPAEVDWSDA
ncbi:hypothetical protein L218DRAFT_1075532 [Marasmius fiardii PR-910]|nr:hypothetical protein L218DRAFT_1075532 [Marasmius fiardii PR-910]